jgi:hypothetical protein
LTLQWATGKAPIEPSDWFAAGLRNVFRLLRQPLLEEDLHYLLINGLTFDYQTALDLVRNYPSHAATVVTLEQMYRSSSLLQAIAGHEHFFLRVIVQRLMIAKNTNANLYKELIGASCAFIKATVQQHITRLPSLISEMRSAENGKDPLLMLTTCALPMHYKLFAALFDDLGDSERALLYSSENIIGNGSRTTMHGVRIRKLFCEYVEHGGKVYHSDLQMFGDEVGSMLLPVMSKPDTVGHWSDASAAAYVIKCLRTREHVKWFLESIRSTQCRYMSRVRFTKESLVHVSVATDTPSIFTDADSAAFIASVCDIIKV